MLTSLYNFIYQLIGWTWQTGQNVDGAQSYVYTTACVVVIMLVAVTVDLLYRIASCIFDFKL